jgi:hypothetical protein
MTPIPRLYIFRRANLKTGGAAAPPTPPAPSSWGDDDFCSPIGPIETQETSVRKCVRVRKQSLNDVTSNLEWSAWPIKERKPGKLWCPTDRSEYSSVLNLTVDETLKNTRGVSHSLPGLSFYELINGSTPESHLIFY